MYESRVCVFCCSGVCLRGAQKPKNAIDNPKLDVNTLANVNEEFGKCRRRMRNEENPNGK